MKRAAPRAESSRAGRGRGAARPLAAGTELRGKFWQGPPAPRPGSPLSRRAGRPGRQPRGAGADGPGEAAPSLPAAERPAALRCRPSLRRALFPLLNLFPLRLFSYGKPRLSAGSGRATLRGHGGGGAGAPCPTPRKPALTAGQSAAGRLWSGLQPGPAGKILLCCVPCRPPPPPRQQKFGGFFFPKFSRRSRPGAGCAQLGMGLSCPKLGARRSGGPGPRPAPPAANTRVSAPPVAPRAAT